MEHLIDSFGRRINYVRMSVTDHCNMACTYCREEYHKTMTPKKEILSFEEISRMSKILSTLGVTKIRITGGEPLLRRDISKLIKSITEIPEITEVPLSTNAELLKANAKSLFQAGIRTLNISIDSLDEKVFSDITRGGDIKKVIAGIDEAIKEGITTIKINAVVMSGVNQSDILNLVNFAIKRDIDIRFIETMPIGSAGMEATKNLLTKKEIKHIVEAGIDGELNAFSTKSTAGPAEMFTVSGTNTKVGFISAVSDKFCSSCNRVRITSKGILILCLGQKDSVDLKNLIRDGKSDEDIREVIRLAIQKKPKEHFFDNSIDNISGAQMIEIGG